MLQLEHAEHQHNLRAHHPVYIKAQKYRRQQNCAKKLIRFMFSHVGLCIMLGGYASGGAWAFIAIEGPEEEIKQQAVYDRSQQIESAREELVARISELSIDEEQQGNRSTTILAMLDEFHVNLSDAIRDVNYHGKMDTLELSWNFPAALLFCITTVALIGYGNIVPKTEFGMIGVIVYSLLGAPLLLIFLTNIGDLLASAIRFTYSRVCCKKRKPAIVEQKQPKTEVPAPTLPAASTSAIAAVAPLDNKQLQVIEQPREKKVRVPAILTIAILAIYVVIGSVIFHYWEHWPYYTSSYFCFVTLATIGFGDYVPGWKTLSTMEGKMKMVVSSFYIILGMALLSMGLNLIVESLTGHFKKAGKHLGIVHEHHEGPKSNLHKFVKREIPQA